MMVIHVDISEVDDELARLEHGPDVPTILGLEGVLASSFTATQAAVHIITGSLKASGSLESDFRDHVWSGELSYGGVAPGAVNDPVVYAYYERRRGGTHDFLAPAAALERQYGEVVMDFLRGDL